MGQTSLLFLTHSISSIQLNCENQGKSWCKRSGQITARKERLEGRSRKRHPLQFSSVRGALLPLLHREHLHASHPPIHTQISIHPRDHHLHQVQFSESSKTLRFVDFFHSRTVTIAIDRCLKPSFASPCALIFGRENSRRSILARSFWRSSSAGTLSRISSCSLD